MVNRTLLGGLGAALLFVSAILLVADDAGPPSPTARVCSSCSVTAVCSSGSCWCCGSSPRSSGTARRERRRLDRGRVTASAEGRATAGERYYRHPGDVVRLVGWASAALLLLLFLAVATATSDGVRDDLGGVVTAVPTAVRQLLLVVVQIAAVVIAVALVAVLAWQRRWRRLATATGAAALGAAAWWLVERMLDEPGRLPGSLAGDSWLLSSRFPSPGALAGAFAALTVGLPWLARPWRRASDIAVAVLTATMALAGTAGAPELLLVLAVGGAVGSAVLVGSALPTAVRRGRRSPRPSPTTGSRRRDSSCNASSVGGPSSTA